MARLNRDDIYADATLRGTPFCRALTERFDRWLRQLYVTATGAPDRRRAGRRRRLRPGRAVPAVSDLDVLLLHDGRPDIGRLAEQLWYPIWDEGLKLGHAVRTPKEALRLAADELDTATSLLDARHVAGDAVVTTELLAAGPRAVVRGRAALAAEAERKRSTSRHASARRGRVPARARPQGGPRRPARRARPALGRRPSKRCLLDADRRHASSRRLRRAARGPRGAAPAHRPAGRPARCSRSRTAWPRTSASTTPTPSWRASPPRPGRSRGSTDEAFDQVVAGGFALPRAGPRTRRVGPGLVLRDGQLHVDEAIAAGRLRLHPAARVARTAASREVRLARATLERFADADLRFPDPWPVQVRDAVRRAPALRARPPSR